jgi:hypothetical protein
MTLIQVILYGMPVGSVHDTAEYPVVLQFAETWDFEEAEWVIPSYPGYLTGPELSEIRVQEGTTFNVYVEGPEGYKSGPHQCNWVRGGYPRGKLVSLLEMGGGKMKGVSLNIVEGSLVEEPVALG